MSASFNTMGEATDPVATIGAFTSTLERAVLVERELKLAAHFPSGSVPYAARSTYLKLVGAPTVGIRKGPLITSGKLEPKPLSHNLKSKYRVEPHHMRVQGWMDPYAFGVSIPKFDPWFRDDLKKIAPGVSTYLEATFTRDPSTPDRICKSILEFDKDWGRFHCDPDFDRAWHVVEKMFSRLNGQCDVIDLSAAGFDRICQQMDMTSSPGLPFIREFRTQGDCLDIIYDHSKRLNHFAKFLEPHKVRAPPCIIAQRPGLLEIDELDHKIKSRGVWAFPAAQKVVEMRYSIPIYEKLTQSWGSSPYPVGVSMLKAVPMLIDHLLHDNRAGLVTDIKGLDHSLHPKIIYRAFDIIERWLNFGENPSMQRRNLFVWNYIKYYFVRTPILMPSGQLLRKYGGVPSGSGFTQLVDTVCTLICTVRGLLRSGFDEEDITGELWAVGDDVAASLPRPVDIDVLADKMQEVGLTLHPDKVMQSYVGKELKFLGYSKDGWRVHRDLLDLFKQAFFPERFVGHAGNSAQRLIGQTLASGMCSPLFSEMAKRAAERVSKSGDRTWIEPWAPVRRFARNVLGIPDLPVRIDFLEVFEHM